MPLVNPVSGVVAKVNFDAFKTRISAPAALALAFEQDITLDGVHGVVCFEVLQDDHHRRGDMVVLNYGPACTYKTIEEVARGKLKLSGDPEVMAYPVCYYEKD